METYHVERLRGADGSWSVFLNGDTIAEGLSERQAADVVQRWTPPGPDVPRVTSAEMAEAQAVRDLISAAAEAVEVFGDDELERFAREDFGPWGDDSDPDGGPVYSYSTPCPVCGEVHPT